MRRGVVALDLPAPARVVPASPRSMARPTRMLRLDTSHLPRTMPAHSTRRYRATIGAIKSPAANAANTRSSGTLARPSRVPRGPNGASQPVAARPASVLSNAPKCDGHHSLERHLTRSWAGRLPHPGRKQACDTKRRTSGHHARHGCAAGPLRTNRDPQGVSPLAMAGVGVSVGR